MFWFNMNDKKKRSEKINIGFVIIFLVLCFVEGEMCVYIIWCCYKRFIYQSSCFFCHSLGFWPFNEWWVLFALFDWLLLFIFSYGTVFNIKGRWFFFPNLLVPPRRVFGQPYCRKYSCLYLLFFSRMFSHVWTSYFWDTSFSKVHLTIARIRENTFHSRSVGSWFGVELCKYRVLNK